MKLEERLNEIEIAAAAVVNSQNQYMAKEQVRKMKKQLLADAIHDLFAYCTSGMKVFEQHQRTMSSIISNDLLTTETISELKQILFVRKDSAAYDSFVEKKRVVAEQVYSKYFNSYTKVIDGKIYNEILGMYWSDDGVWEIVENGWHRFTAFMPYQSKKSA